MNTTLSKWGNSLAVRIPAQIANEAGLHEGVSLRVEYAEGALHLCPVAEVPTLDEMVNEITDENRHEEIDFEASVGEESW